MLRKIVPILALLACDVDQIGVAPNDAAVPTIVTIGGPYVGWTGWNAVCDMEGDRFEMTIEIDGHDAVVTKRPDMVCSHERFYDQTRVGCRGITASSWLQIEDDFSIRINDDDSGVFEWWADGREYFGCVFVFSIDEVKR